MDEAAILRLQKGLQKRLRGLVLQCLSHLQLDSDKLVSEVEPGLMHVQNLISAFEEEQDEGEQDVSLAAQQGGAWQCLKDAVGKALIVVRSRSKVSLSWEDRCAQLASWSEHHQRLPKRHAEDAE